MRARRATTLCLSWSGKTIATVAVPIDILSGRPDVTNPPEYVYITGTNFPSDGYAFPNPGASKAVYARLGAELYGNSGNWTLDIHWYSRSSSTSGNVTWSIQLAAITPGDAQSVETKAFATAQTVNTTVNATAKGLTLSSATITNLDSVNAGDSVWLKITRTDTSMVGDAILSRLSASYSDGTTGTAGSGDVVGPASATTTAIALYNGTTGKLIQNSAISVDPSGNMTGVGTINGNIVDTAVVSASELQRVFQSALPTITGALAITNTGYFVYVGFVREAITVNRVEWFVTAAGTGTSNGECGLFSSPNPPNRTAQNMTKIVATATIDTNNTVGLRRNTSAFAQAVAAGTHLWAGYRCANTTAQPAMYGLTGDIGDGRIMTATTPGVLTAAGPFTGVLATSSVTAWLCPMLRVTLD